VKPPATARYRGNRDAGNSPSIDLKQYDVPTLDLVIYMMGGNNGQYDPTLTDAPQPKDVDTSRDNCKPIARTPFNEGSLGGDDGLRRVLEMVVGAVRD
jgi:hypothetical protein